MTATVVEDDYAYGDLEDVDAVYSWRYVADRVSDGDGGS